MILTSNKETAFLHSPNIHRKQHMFGYGVARSGRDNDFHPCKEMYVLGKHPVIYNSQVYLISDGQMIMNLIIVGRRQ